MDLDPLLIRSKTQRYKRWKETRVRVDVARELGKSIRGSNEMERKKTSQEQYVHSIIWKKVLYKLKEQTIYSLYMIAEWTE